MVALVLSLGVANAFAAEGDYNITVTNSSETMSIVGKTYKAYKVFDLTLGNATTTTDPDTNESTTTYGAYAYSISNTDWAWSTLTAGVTANAETGVITTNYGIVLTPSATDSSVYVIDGDSMTEANARSLADALYKAGLPSAPAGQATASAQSVTIPLSEAGYYAVYGTVISNDPDAEGEVVAALSLTSTDPNADVYPKASVPSLNKEITGEHKLDAAGKAAVAQVGQPVSFKLTSAVPDVTGYTKYTYIISDTMSNGLTFTDPEGAATNDIVVTIGGTDKTSAVTIDFPTTQSFTVTIPLSVLSAEGTNAGDPIEVTYSAILNENALTTDFEKNTAKLTYSHSPYDDKTNDTPESEVYVIDVNIDVNKIANGQEAKKLDGAKFVLFKGETQPADTALAWYKYDNNKVTWVAKEDADEFVTDSTGKLDHQFQGLEGEAAGTNYGLLETVAPTGYNLLDTPIIITLTTAYDGTANTATITATNATVTGGTINIAEGQHTSDDQHTVQPVATATVNNNSGSVLPSTGGIGTTIFYVVGGVLVLAAIILLVTKKRMSE